MTFIEQMHEIAREKKKCLVLPEGTEKRTLEAAAIIVQKKIAAETSLIGPEEKIRAEAKTLGINLRDIAIIEPANADKRDAYAQEYYQLRKHKGMTADQSYTDMGNNLRWGCMMVHLSDADAMVAGAENTTGDVLKAAFTIIKTKPGIKSASSCFIIIGRDKRWGHEGQLIFSDCATIPNPNAEQLAEIAKAAAESCAIFLGVEPKVAMLSFSTKGSAKTDETEKIIMATELVKSSHPDLLIDGELQLDAAIVPSIAKKKAPDSPVAGSANTLIFPNLQSGNIGYKLVQRFAQAEAIGPILQGFAKPVSDLSRGCSVDDIVNTAALTISQCK